MIEGPRGEIWSLDESLRQIARELLIEYPDLVGHIDLQHVVFTRCRASRNIKWLGKCTRVKPPVGLLPYYAASLYKKTGAMDVVYQIDPEDLDTKYIISVNESAIEVAGGDTELIERVTLLHELMHIDDEMNGLVKHNIEDFAIILEKFGVHWTSGSFANENDGAETIS